MPKSLIEELQVDDMLWGFLVKFPQTDISDMKQHLFSHGYDIQKLDVKNGWYRKVPRLNECREPCGHQVIEAEPNSKGAFRAALVEILS